MFERVKKVVSNWFRSGPERTVCREPRVIGPQEHGIDPRLMSGAARRTCEILQQRGFKAYIVGGAVRDMLLGVTPKDFDVATDATPTQVKRCQRRAFIIGKRFKIVHVVFGEEIIECSTFRALDADGVRKDSAGRVISDNVYGEMWEDAARRDFTANALYYDPATQNVLDYHHGYEDIKRGCLRMIGDPQVRYREDPVRMMRAVRIAAKLGFNIESATEAAIPRMARLLDNVPAARLFDEMMKLFTSGHAEKCLIKLRKEGLHRSLLPMLDVMLEEPDGEEFLMLALRRTDERIAVGKKISPAFMFATLLWPQVRKRWAAYQGRQKMKRPTALYAASDDVVATQCARLAIQRRFVADMKLIWMLQLRLERRTGKNPYTLVAHPKYRAGYDFMLLRSLVGEVPSERVQWWDTFAQGDEALRAQMVAEQEHLARATGDKARAGNRAKAGAAARAEERLEGELIAEIEDSALPARERRRRQERREARAGRSAADAGDVSRFEERAQESADIQILPETELPAPKKKRRNRRRSKSLESVNEAVGSAETPEMSDQIDTEAAQPRQSSTDEPVKGRRRRAAKQLTEDPVQTDSSCIEPGTTSSVTDSEQKESTAPASRKKRTPRKQAQTPAAETPELQPVLREVVTADGGVLVQVETARPRQSTTRPDEKVKQASDVVKAENHDA